MSTRILPVIFSMAMIGIAPHPTAAELPDDVTVEYYMYEAPSNASSDIVFVVKLDLTATDSDGDSVGWEISDAEFTEVGASPALDRDWRDNSASFSTADGLWWVEHDDPTEPVLSEFLIPPLLTGAARAEDPADEDLEYEIEGHSPGARQEPYTPTAFLNYIFTEDGEEGPIVEEEDEPSEPDGVDDPS